MSLIVIGLNHQSASIDLRERLAFSATRLGDVLPGLTQEFQTSELVLLSTCNRTEFYLDAADSQSTKQKVHRFIQQNAGTQPVETHVYAREETEAVHHLFRVAGGLDSMVVGEQEILSQVKQAYLAAQQAGCTGKLMNVLFQRSLYVGKRVRTETGLSLGSASIGSVAVAMAGRIFGDLRDKRVLIMGAGKMAELTAKHLLSQKVHSVLVSNRTFERAQELARQFDGKALRHEEGLKEMEHVDIVICSTAAPHPIISAQQVAALMPRRKGRSLFFIDIAVPRDVHPDVHGIDNVYVYNIDDLELIVKENRTKRKREVSLAEAIINQKSEEFSRWLSAHRSGQEHALHHYTGGSEKLSNPDLT